MGGRGGLSAEQHPAEQGRHSGGLLTGKVWSHVVVVVV